MIYPLNTLAIDNVACLIKLEVHLETYFEVWCNHLSREIIPVFGWGLLIWNLRHIFVVLFKIVSLFLLLLRLLSCGGDTGDIGESNMELNSVSVLMKLVPSVSVGKSSSVSSEDSCKYCGSKTQNPPLPGSSFVRLIFLKHLFKDKLCRMEFCWIGNEISSK